MYFALFVIFAGMAAYLFFVGLKQRSRRKVWGGLMLGLLTILFPQFMEFWGEMLWFQAIGYGQRFWTVIFAEAGLTIVTFIFGVGFVYFLTFSVGPKKPLVRIIASLVGGFFGGMWGYANWEIFLQFWYRVSTDVIDPILGQDTGFYLFTFPFLQHIYSLLLILTIIALMASLAVPFMQFDNALQFEPLRDSRPEASIFGSVYVSSAVLILVLAFGKFVDRYALMYSEWGAVHGPGWTDVHIRLPVYNIIWIVTALAGLIVLLPFSRKKLQRKVSSARWMTFRTYPTLPGVVLVLIFGIWVVFLNIVPNLLQWLRVEPNEITFEKPYIVNNITFTQHGFRLHEIEEKEFPASETLTPQMVEQNQVLFDNVRLWDWRALDAVYRQFQEIRLYYEFRDVDIDRYVIDNNYRQVMVSAREMEIDNLPAQSQTFINQRFKYTHGYGITLTTVNDFTPEGLPNLLIKDIPPQSAYPSLEVERPEIYYGELTNTHVIVNTEEEEFDYPSGEANQYARYAGEGGVEMSNFWRKFIFGYMFDGTRLLLSSYPTPQSRIMYHRQISERVKNLAPFLLFEEDPYIVLDNGRLKWIIDAYTTSQYYPYSEPFSGREMIEYNEDNNGRILVSELGRDFVGINYMRNSVKAVVDAYNGAVDFYIFEPDDPIVQVWDKAFPGLFKPKEEMSENLLAHVRYPENMLLIQGLVYAKYHMTDPEVFYNQEDLWIRATEKYYDQVQPVQPYYIMWELPDSEAPEFVVIQPFTPKNRQVLIGWMAGMCDPENYGRLLAYKFPKERRILGPQQVETKIDQDSYLSGQLSLWGQRGSNVIRGNVLAIPIENTIIYVEPIYLESETAAYPELRLVVVMHNDNLSYAPTFEQAVQGLFDTSLAGVTPAPEQLLERETDQQDTVSTLIQQANDAFERYLQLTGNKDFEGAARELNNLEQLLKELLGEENQPVGGE